MAHRPSPLPRPQRNLLGVRLREARERRGWTQGDLARELQLAGWDLGRTGVTKIELRERCVTDFELIILARLLGVSLHDLTINLYADALAMVRPDGDG